MPGTPIPVLGSDAVTFGVACAAAFLVASMPYALRERLPAANTLAVVGGVAFAVGSVAVWAAARAATIGFGQFGVDVWLVGVFVLGLVVLGAQAAVPLFLYARWNLVSALAALFVSVAFVLFLFLRVAGESDPFFLHAVFFGPVMLAGVCVVAAAELGLRRVLGGADRAAA